MYAITDQHLKTVRDKTQLKKIMLMLKMPQNVRYYHRGLLRTKMANLPIVSKSRIFEKLIIKILLGDQIEVKIIFLNTLEHY